MVNSQQVQVNVQEQEAQVQSQVQEIQVQSQVQEIQVQEIQVQLQKKNKIPRFMTEKQCTTKFFNKKQITRIQCSIIENCSECSQPHIIGNDYERHSTDNINFTFKHYICTVEHGIILQTNAETREKIHYKLDEIVAKIKHFLNAKLEVAYM